MTMMKAGLAVAKVTADLITKGYVVFTPALDFLRFDLIAYKDNTFTRIQVKHSNLCPHFLRASTKRNKKETKYQDNDFDYYGVYLADIDKVIYPSIKFKGKQIRTTLPKVTFEAFWYEDFVNFTDKAIERKLIVDREYKYYPKTNRKVIRPSKEELEKLVWEKPTSQIAKDFGVTDNSVAKWCKSYNIDKPPRGFWAKKYSQLTQR